MDDGGGIWTLRRERKRRLHQPRGRRDCLGEMVQIDGSHHWWLEERRPKSALLVFIDDATAGSFYAPFPPVDILENYSHENKIDLLQII